MVYVYLADSRTLPDPARSSDRCGLTPRETECVLRLVSASARKERSGARLLLRAVLPRFGKRIDEIYCGENGKPTVQGLHFNLSHSGGKVALAVSDAPVGCDIETLKPAPLVIERKFSAAEREYLSSFFGEERDRAFFRLWTAKESYIKMTGEGLRALSLAEVDVAQNAVYRQGERQNCVFHTFEAADHLLTVCAADGPFSEPELMDVTEKHG